MLIKFNNLHQYFWTSELLLIQFASCMLYSYWNFLVKTVVIHYLWICILYIYASTISPTPPIALHETLCEFFMYLYVQVIIKKNISFCNYCSTWNTLWILYVSVCAGNNKKEYFILQLLQYMKHFVNSLCICMFR